MAQVIDIVPVQELGRIKGAPMHMVLTHLVENYPHYREFMEKEEGYKILDNSLIELGGAVTTERLMKAAISVGADEIILPDIFKDKDRTIAAVDSSLYWLDTCSSDGDRGKVMAVAQGSTLSEIAACFEHFMSYKEIDVIGIPKVASVLPWSVSDICTNSGPIGRHALEYLWRDRGLDKEIHLLGCWYSWAELSMFQAPEQIRSVDSCLRSFFYAHNCSLRPEGMTVDLEKSLSWGKHGDWKFWSCGVRGFKTYDRK